MKVSARFATSGRNGGVDRAAVGLDTRPTCRWAGSPGGDHRTHAPRASRRSSGQTPGSPASAPRCARHPRASGWPGSPGSRGHVRCCPTASSPRRCRPRAEGTDADSLPASASPACCPRATPMRRPALSGRGPLGSAKRGRHARSARRQRPHRSQNAHIKVTSTARPSRSGDGDANDPRRTPEEGGVRRGSGPLAVVVTDGEIISPVARRRMTRSCTWCQGVVNPVHERRLDADDRGWARYEASVRKRSRDGHRGGGHRT